MANVTEDQETSVGGVGAGRQKTIVCIELHTKTKFRNNMSYWHFASVTVLEVTLVAGGKIRYPSSSLVR